METLLLSRIQFAMTVGFHFLFPPITIGLAWLLVIVEWMGWKNKDEAYVEMGKFFAKLLAIIFAVGVATGIVMEFQFGMNWANYSRFVGDIFGSFLAAEAVFAFFLESAFMGLYLFGREKVSKGVHFFSILMVAVGSTISAFWILVANSWQQTPAGFKIVENASQFVGGIRPELTNFWEAAFNPSTFQRFYHTMDASLITGVFFLGGISAYLVMKGNEKAKKTLRLSVLIGIFVVIAGFFPSGHYHAEQVAKTQPSKLAAMEGIYDTEKGAEFALFGIPTEDKLAFAIRLPVPGLLSILATGHADGVILGLNDTSKRPELGGETIKRTDLL